MNWKNRFTEWRKKFFFTRAEAFAMVDAETQRLFELGKQHREELAQIEKDLILASGKVCHARTILQDAGVIRSEVTLSRYIFTDSRYPVEFMEHLFHKLADDILEKAGEGECWYKFRTKRMKKPTDVKLW